MKPPASVTAIALCLLSCACGGSGGGSIGTLASAPAPAPSPTPTPTPSPGFIPTVTPTETLSGTTATTQPIGTTGTEEVLDASRVSIGRDVAGNYLITLPVATGQNIGLSQGFQRKFEFLAANRTTTASGAQQYTLGRSGSILPNEKSFLTILPAGTAANPLKYVNFASLLVTLTEGGFGDPPIPVHNVIAFGDRTLVSDLPLTGSASYSGTFATTYSSRGFSVAAPPESDNTAGGGFATAGQLSGDLRMSVNFADKGISGSLANISDSTQWFAYADTDFNHRLADLAMTGTFATDGTISGTIAPAAGTPFTGGIWNGMFFGPQAAEVGGSLILRADIFNLPTHFSGWFGGQKN